MISGILILKCGFGVNMFLIRLYIFTFIFFRGYFIEAFTMLSFPSSWNGCVWKFITNRTHPNIHTSTRSSIGNRRYKSIISGGRYIKVVFFSNFYYSLYIWDLFTLLKSIFYLSQLPKSQSFALPLCEMRMFSILMSLWTIPWLCIYWRPFAASRESLTIWDYGSYFFLSMAYKTRSKTVFYASYMRMYASRKP
jgi:hypothetical protein